MALAARIRLADPDIERAQVGFGLAPVPCRLQMRIAHLHAANRPAIKFGDPVFPDIGLVEIDVLGPVIVLAPRNDRIRIIAA